MGIFFYKSGVKYRATASYRVMACITEPTKAKTTETRNVIVVGKTGSGKSTVANHILGTVNDKFKVSGAPSSVTSKAMPKNSEFEYDNVRYRLTVIDTIGLFDTDNFSDKQILKNTKETIKEFVKGLHLIVFVVKEGRFTDDEKKTFDLIHKEFYNCIDPISLLVVTGCEGKDKTIIINDYQQNPVTRWIVAHMKKGVVPVGFPDLSGFNGTVREFFTKEALKDEVTLRKIVCGSETMFLKEELYNDSWCTIL